MTDFTIKQLLRYNPDTGAFTWVVDRGTRHKAGHPAGCVHGSGYVHIITGGKCYKAHRLAFLLMGEPIPAEVDHINHDRSDNRWENLRAVTHIENGRNQQRHTTNTSGVAGVCFYKPSKTWLARIYVDGVSKHLGYFKEMSEAVSARVAATKLHGFHNNHGGSMTND